MTAITFTKSASGGYEHIFTSDGKTRVFQLRFPDVGLKTLNVFSRIGSDLPWAFIGQTSAPSMSNDLIATVYMPSGCQVRLSSIVNPSQAHYSVVND